MSNIAIRIENVSKQYRLGAIGGTTFREEMHRLGDKLFHRTPTNPDMGKEFMALDGINLEVKKGERLGIIGHNGAGKSTLLKLLARVTAPTTGTISYNGRISSMLEVGTGFHKELTGRENIYMNGAILGMSKREIDSKIDAIIAFAEMEKFIDTPVKRYSSGMYVKLAFAVAAHLDNEILIMDEVLAVGDANFQQKCLGKMDDVSRESGKTILYVSHNMNTIRQLCSRCIVLDHGKKLYDGDVNSAISLYMGLLEVSPHTIELSQIKRTSRCHGGVRASSLEIISNDSWRLPLGKKLSFALNLHSELQVTDLKFRFRLTTPDNTSISVLIGDAISVDCAPDKNYRIQFLADISSLVPSKYMFSISIFKTNDYGTTQYYDFIPHAVVFEIQDSVGFNQNIPWQTASWGYVRFPDLELTSLQVL